MARDTPPPSQAQPRRDALPDDHLALVVADALAASDTAMSAGASPSAASGLRAAILYGWAIGAVGAREQATLAQTDLGLQYLLADQRPSFPEIRRFREANRATLEAEYGAALAICRAAGLTRLGRIGLPKSAGISGFGTNRFVARARKLLDEAEVADLHDDLEVGAASRGDELPPALAPRGARQAAFRRVARDRPAIRPPRRAVAVARMVLSAVAALALLLGGLLLIRWVGAANAAVTYSGQARVPVAAPTPDAIATSVPAIETPEEIDLVAASREGVRLGMLALADDDLRGARDFFFLASQALPTNTVAADRLRQVETALRIEERTDDWAEAVEDLAELRRLEPASPSVLRAYVTALVRAGQDALAAGDATQATIDCGEALRWLPARTDAQACLTAANRTATAQTLPRTTTPTASPQSPPVATATPLQVVAEPRPVPTSASAPERPGLPTAIMVTVSGGCRPTLAGTRSVQVAGQVSAEDEAVPGATVRVQIADAEGRVVDTSSFPVASQRFALQRTVPGGGAHTVTVTATAAGYDPGEATARVSC
jgi:hypothetical protein